MIYKGNSANYLIEQMLKDKNDFSSKPHKNLATWTNTDYSHSNSILNTQNDDYQSDNCRKEIKYVKQKEQIKSLKNRINFAKSNGDNATEAKGVIYDELASLGNQITSLDYQNQRLQAENRELKDTLKSKDDMLLQFQEIVLNSTEKFKQLEQLNESLRAKIKAQEETSAQTFDEVRRDQEAELAALLHQIKSLESDNKHLSEQVKAYQLKENETKALYESFKDIQREIKNLEETYTMAIEDKGRSLIELKKEIEVSHEEKQRCTDTAEKMMKDNEMLQYQVNLLEREKEILMGEKTKDHQEIIYLRQNYQWDKGSKAYRENRLFAEEESLAEVFEKKEAEYMREITSLHGVILDRENEIVLIKQKLFKKIHDISIEKERLEMKLFENTTSMRAQYNKDNVAGYFNE